MFFFFQTDPWIQRMRERERGWPEWDAQPRYSYKLGKTSLENYSRPQCILQSNCTEERCEGKDCAVSGGGVRGLRDGKAVVESILSNKGIFDFTFALVQKCAASPWRLNGSMFGVISPDRLSPRTLVRFLSCQVVFVDFYNMNRKWCTT